MSDAFYIYTDDAGNPIIPWHPTEFYNWTLWINGGPADNFVSPIPPYSPEHVYTFEMLAPGGPLTFAVGDTYTIDNTGAYTVSVVPLLVAVDVDIKPGSDPNAINPRNLGVIPVAIVTTEDFDATTVDPLSVEFGPGGAMEAHGTGHVEDVDRDGDLDLMLHFKTQETGIQCGDTSATLIGKTFAGQRIEGSDSIATVGCK
jgi:hypothetical protein